MSAPPPLPPPLPPSQDPSHRPRDASGQYTARIGHASWSPQESPPPPGGSYGIPVTILAFLFLGVGAGIVSFVALDDAAPVEPNLSAIADEPATHAADTGLTIVAATSAAIVEKEDRKAAHDPGEAAAWTTGVTITTPGLSELAEREARKSAADPGNEPAIDETY